MTDMTENLDPNPGSAELPVRRIGESYADLFDRLHNPDRKVPRQRSIFTSDASTKEELADARRAKAAGVHVIHASSSTRTPEELADDQEFMENTRARKVEVFTDQWVRTCPPGTRLAHIDAQPDPVLRTNLKKLLTGILDHTVKNARLIGPTGTGKTYAAAALCRGAVENGRPVAWVTMVDLADLAGPRPDYDKLKRVRTASLLVIDDWRAKKHTTSVVELVKDILDRRTDLATIWTTNMPMPTTDDDVWAEVAGLAKWFSEAEKGELAEQLDRIYDRMRLDLVEILFGGQSLRAADRLQAAREAEKTWWDTTRPGAREALNTSPR